MSKRFRLGIFLPGFALLAALAATPDDLRVSGPYTHDNLSVFLVHRAGSAAAHPMTTLQEAMDRKVTVVYETSQVNKLAIENVSDKDVYIQSGDIVKGGQQDRVLSTDLVLPPHSGRVPIDAFCVEPGRWTKRGVEPADSFAASNRVVSGKELKMAVMDKKNQQEVWDKVADTRQSLMVATASPAAASRTAGGTAGGVMGGVIGGVPGGVPAAPQARAMQSTSMQMMLEDNKVVSATAAYTGELAKITAGKDDAVGYVYAINGKIVGADLYGSHGLFQQMWPKLLQASATEAAAEKAKGKAPQSADAAAVKKFLADSERAGAASTKAAGRVTVVKRESAETLVFESQDPKAGVVWLHRSYVVK
jgi:hypothetical protein